MASTGGDITVLALLVLLLAVFFFLLSKRKKLHPLTLLYTPQHVFFQDSTVVLFLAFHLLFAAINIDAFAECSIAFEVPLLVCVSCTLLARLEMLMGLTLKAKKKKKMKKMHRKSMDSIAHAGGGGSGSLSFAKRMLELETFKKRMVKRVRIGSVVYLLVLVLLIVLACSSDDNDERGGGSCGAIHSVSMIPILLLAAGLGGVAMKIIKSRELEDETNVDFNDVDILSRFCVIDSFFWILYSVIVLVDNHTDVTYQNTALACGIVCSVISAFVVQTGALYLGHQTEKTYEVAGSLPVILDHSDGSKLFMQHLKEEFSSENLEFWWAARKYAFSFAQNGDSLRTESSAKSSLGRKSSFSATCDLDSVRRSAILIHATYIKSTAPLCVNIPHSIKSDIEDAIETGLIGANLFHMAEEEIFALMKKDSFPRFLRSRYFTTYKNKLVREKRLNSVSLSTDLKDGVVGRLSSFQSLQKRSATGEPASPGTDKRKSSGTSTRVKSSPKVSPGSIELRSTS